MNTWNVLYTKPKAEKKVASRLAECGFKVYCPVVKTVRQWSDRKKRITVPLFASYVFIQVPPAQREEVFFIPGVVRYLYWLGKPAIVWQHEIDAIKDFLNDYGKNSFIKITHLSPGQRVKVVKGPFAEQSGEVVRVSKNRVILEILSLGIGIQADLHYSQIA
jgi:transcriptional antiterminator RfaH